MAPALEDVLHVRADYLQAMLRVDVAGIALSVTHDDLLPDLALSFQWARDDTGHTQNQVRMDATVPLNDRGPALERLRAEGRQRDQEGGEKRHRAARVDRGPAGLSQGVEPRLRDRGRHRRCAAAHDCGGAGPCRHCNNGDLHDGRGRRGAGGGGGPGEDVVSCAVSRLSARLQQDTRAVRHVGVKRRASSGLGNGRR